MVKRALTALVLANFASSLASVSYRFTFTSLAGAKRELQLQEILLFDRDQIALTGSAATNPGGDSPRNQPPADVIDGDASTKGCAARYRPKVIWSAVSSIPSRSYTCLR